MKRVDVGVDVGVLSWKRSGERDAVMASVQRW